MAAAVVESTKKAPDPSRTWLGQRAKRTQAIPKHSLQGASLEIFKKDEREAVSQIDVKQYEADVNKERLARQERYKKTLPEYLKQHGGPMNDEFQNAKSELVKQMQETTQARQMMDTLELNSKYFNVGLYEDGRQSSSPADKKPSWYGKQDLKHSGDINITGLPDPANYTSNYNRDKYGRRVPVHQYAVIGDPLKKGMDFTEKSSSPRRSMTTYERHRDPDWLPRDAYMKQSKADQSDLAIQLPPNIQHTFGSRICRSVLNDKDKVDSTIDDQKRLEASFYRTRDGKKSAFKLPSDDIDPVYEGLSHAVRQNMFPGYTYNHKKSLMKSVYSEDVHNRRLKDPDQWRYQRDELSTWAEQNVLRERVKKAWDGYLADTLGGKK